MNGEQQQTSVFIAQTNHHEGEDERNSTPNGCLLSTSASSPPRTTSSPPRATVVSHRSKRRLLIVFVATGVLILLLAILVMLIVLLATPTPGPIGSSDPFTYPCIQQNDSVLLVETSVFYKPSSTPISPTEQCGNQALPSWRIFNSDSSGFSDVINLLSPKQRNSTTALLLSPLFYPTSPDSCSIRFSFNISLQNSSTASTTKTSNTLQVYHVTKENATHVYTVTSPACKRVILDNVGKSPFRVAIAAGGPIDTNNVAVAVTSHPCVAFKTLALEPKITNNLTEVTVGQRSSCSSEIFQKSKVQCQWMNVLGGDSGDFAHIQDHSCVEAGVNYARKHSWFLAFAPAKPGASAFLASPIVKRGSAKLLFSLWYLMQCDGPHLRAHVVPYEGSTITGPCLQSGKSFEIRNTKPQSTWQFEMFQVELPAEHLYYQVIIEAIIPSRVNCSGHSCYLLTGEELKTPESPLIVLDDIVLETLHETCNVSGANDRVPINLNCTFQTKSGSTYCNWTSSSDYDPIFAEYYNDPDLQAFHNDWKLQNSTEYDDQGHGATSGHFEGRGFIMSFDATGKAEQELYVRSPLLTAGSNCSCGMTFLYLLRGTFAPRLQVNLVVGPDMKDENRPLLLQWTMHGHQGENWRTARLVLNLKTDVIFQVEIRVSEVLESRADVSIDDLLFHHCDIHSYVSG